MSWRDGGTGIASPSGLFGGKLIYRQPPAGFRTSVDSLALAYFAACGTTYISPTTSPPRAIADLCCGSGFLALLAALLWPLARITGVEISSAMVACARANVAANGMEDRVEILEMDLTRFPVGAGNAFDLILCNPPFYPIGWGTLPADPQMARARFEVAVTMAQVVQTSAGLLAPGGTLLLIYPPSRRAALLDVAGDLDLRCVAERAVCPCDGARASHELFALRACTRSEHMPATSHARRLDEVSGESCSAPTFAQSMRSEPPLLLEGAGGCLGPELASLVSKFAGDQE